MSLIFHTEDWLIIANTLEKHLEWGFCPANHLNLSLKLNIYWTAWINWELKTLDPLAQCEDYCLILLFTFPNPIFVSLLSFKILCIDYLQFINLKDHFLQCCPHSVFNPGLWETAQIINIILKAMKYENVRINLSILHTKLWQTHK